MKAEFENLLEEGHIRKVEKVNDEVFKQPVVITVKKHKSVKIVLDAFQKDKYQLPNLVNFMKQVAEIITEENEEEVRYTSIDMAYAYGQTELHPNTARHCNSQIIGAEQRVHTPLTPDTTAYQ